MHGTYSITFFCNISNEISKNICWSSYTIMNVPHDIMKTYTHNALDFYIIFRSFVIRQHSKPLLCYIFLSAVTFNNTYCLLVTLGQIWHTTQRFQFVCHNVRSEILKKELGKLLLQRFCYKSCFATDKPGSTLKAFTDSVGMTFTH